MKSSPPLPSPAPARKKNGAGWRRRLPWLAALVLVAAIVAGLWPRAVPVEVATVVRGPLVVTVDEEGMTRVKHRHVVAAPVSGQLRRIDWKAGATVEAGRTVLAVLETGAADLLDARMLAQAEAREQGAQSAREMAAAQRERARAAARVAQAEYERVKALHDGRVVSALEFDAAQARRDTAAQDERAAEFALQVADAEWRQAQALLSRGKAGGDEPVTVTSPVSGRILRVLQESERPVPAGFPLVEVGDPTDLEVRIEVLSRDGVGVPPGAKVRLEQWGGPAPLQARVRLVEPSAFTKISALGVEEQRVYVVADFVDPVERRPTLGDNYRVEARIVIWEQADALRAPAGALFQKAGTWQTYVVEGGRAARRSVKIGRSNGVETEVIEGLAVGESVIVYPGDKVTDGARVTSLTVSGR